MSKRKLLLADDSVTIQKVVNLTFADEGIDVIAVGNGDQAMERISELRPDMVLADVNMPGLTGYQICERLRGNPDTSTIPVLLLVGSFEPFDAAEARRVGANGHLTKPFQSIRQLVAKVSELMQETSTEAPESAMLPDEETASDAFSVDIEPHQEHADRPTHWSEAVVEEPETQDIDHLYKDSFAQTVEIPHSETFHAEASAAERFADVGMDDEMIETTYHAPSTYRPDEPDHDPEFTHPAAPSPFEQRVSESTSPGQKFRSVASDPSRESTDAQTTDQNGITAVDVPMQDDTVRFDAPVTQPAAEPSFDLDAAELLELPEPPAVNSMRVLLSDENAHVGAHEQLVTLSPELMDAIVRQVVEKMSGGR